MRGTEAYHLARLAGAKPVVLAYVSTDMATRCFGKQTPHAAWLDSDRNAVEWAARVLQFGDYRISLATDSENIPQTLTQQEMTSYTLVCDNADLYFTDLLDAEILLNGEVVIVQGFDVAGFTDSDFLTLYTGRIERVDFRGVQCLLQTVQALKPQIPDDPTVDTTTIYALETDGGTEIGAEETLSYEELEHIFYITETLTFTVEFTRNTDTAAVLLAIENQTNGDTRLEIGVDSDSHPYVKVNQDISTTPADFVTFTGDQELGTGEQVMHGELGVDDSGNVVCTLNDGEGYSSESEESGSYSGWALDRTFLEDATADLTGLARDTSNQVYVTGKDMDAYPDETAAPSGYNAFYDLASGAEDRFGRAGEAQSFNGTSDSVAMTTPTATTTGSVAIWIYCDVAGKIDAMGWKGATLERLRLDDGQVGNEFCLSIRDSGGTWNRVYSGVEIAAETWYHVVGTWDGAGMSIYVNGELQATNDKYTDGVPDDVVSATIGFAGHTDIPAFHHDGKLDDAYVYSRALTAAEVRTLFMGKTSDGIRQYSSTGVLLNTLECVESPQEVAIDSSRYVWAVCSSWREFVARINPYDDTYTTLLSFDSGETPAGIVIPSTQVVLVGIQGASPCIRMFSFDGDKLLDFGGSDISNPVALAVDAIDNLYVLDSSDEAIHVFGSNHVFLRSISLTRTPVSFTRTVDDQFFVLMSDDNIYHLDVDGDVLTSFGGLDISGGKGIVHVKTAIDEFLLAGQTGADTVLRFANRTDSDAGEGWKQDQATTSDDDLIIGEGLDGSILSVQVNDQFRLQNADNTATVFEDVISEQDVTVQDGEWVAKGTIDTYTAEIEITDTTQFSVFEQLPLSTVGETYPNPGSSQQNVFLPLLYGNLRENADRGVVECPCIDSINYVYCVSGWPVQSVSNGNIITVYVDGEFQASGYTFDESNDYLGLGEIATLSFGADPGGSVSVKCHGKADASGDLIENPVDVIEDLLDYAAEQAGTDGWEINQASFTAAKVEAAARNYTVAGVISEARSLGDWLKAILAACLGTFFFDGDGKLNLRLMSADPSENVQETIDEYQAISGQADLSQSLQNLCTRLVMHYAHTRAQVDRRFKANNAQPESYDRTYEGVSTSAYRKYGEAKFESRFDWLRNTTMAENIATLLFQRYNGPTWTIHYQGQDCKFLPLNLFDQVQGTFRLLPDTDVVCDLRELTVNLDEFTSTLTLQIAEMTAIDLIPESGVYIGDDPVYISDAPVYIGE